jgi:hypothetical protein
MEILVRSRLERQSRWMVIYALAGCGEKRIALLLSGSNNYDPVCSPDGGELAWSHDARVSWISIESLQAGAESVSS